MGSSKLITGFSRDIKDAHPYLRDRWELAQKTFTREGHDYLVLTCSHRSLAEQNRLYQIGRTSPGKIVTHIDGIKRMSEHNYYPSRAIDVAVVSLGKIVWDEKAYEPLGIVCKTLDLVWGGAWKKFKDLPHIQIPSHIK